MWKFIFSCIGLLWGAMLAEAQTPTYILYDRSCMDQLEYRNASTGATAYVYTLKREPEIKIFFTLSGQVIYPPTLPDGYKKCAEIGWNDAIMDAVGAGKQTAYIIFQTSSGFSMYAVDKVLRIQRTGSRYELKSGEYHFAVDTNRLFLETNLAYPGSSHYAFYTGFRQERCLREYSFLLEPTIAGGKRTELSVIPSLGIVYERSGANAAEIDRNQMRLQSFNTVFLDEYISKLCTHQGTQTYRTVPQGAPTVQYGLRDGTGYGELNKEDFVSGQKYGYGQGNYNYPYMSARPVPVANYSTAVQGPALINCPTPPGMGYHIVQPGESLNAIARTYAVPAGDIVKWNKIKNPNHLTVCQQLYLVDPVRLQEKMQNTKGIAAKPADTVQKQTPYWRTADGRTWAQLNESDPPPPGMTRVHVVQLGENLIGIANHYELPESALRKWNNLPATGNVIIYPGQALVISDVSSASPKSDLTTVKTIDYSTPASSTPAAAIAQPVATPAPAPQTFSEMSINKPVSVNTTATNYNTPAVDITTTPATTVATPAQTYPAATAYKEHVVKQGETLPAIAAQYNASAEEIAFVNGIAVNETLIAGKRLQVPIR